MKNIHSRLTAFALASLFSLCALSLNTSTIYAAEPEAKAHRDFVLGLDLSCTPVNETQTIGDFAQSKLEGSFELIRKIKNKDSRLMRAKEFMRFMNADSRFSRLNHQLRGSLLFSSTMSAMRVDWAKINNLASGKIKSNREKLLAFQVKAPALSSESLLPFKQKLVINLIADPNNTENAFRATLLLDQASSELSCNLHRSSVCYDRKKKARVNCGKIVEK